MIQGTKFEYSVQVILCFLSYYLLYLNNTNKFLSFDLTKHFFIKNFTC